ncbi:hypothetical protein N3K60_17430, partial [Escherichia coli]|uniref:hypothetical protein n=1 Tax=Escherichia coli TaxID=562 RepID=UPI0021BE27DA
MSQERWRPNLNEVQKKQQRTKPWLLQYNSYACRISEKTYSTVSYTHLKKKKKKKKKKIKKNEVTQRNAN